MFSTTDEIKFFIEPQIRPYRGPLFITRSLESPIGDNIIVNGGFGLVDTGTKKLLVTCNHVWEKFREEHREDPNVRMCVCLDRWKPVVFDDHAPIDQDDKLDIATFDIAPVLAACNRREFYPLHRNPPSRLMPGDKLVLVGNQGIFRSVAAQGLEFGVTTYACEVSDISGLRIVSDISTAREDFIMQPVRTPVSEASLHGGISGSPVFLVRADRPVHLVGFVTADWQDSLWFIHARCLNSDGTINREDNHDLGRLPGGCKPN